jgi:uncharacterized protein (UPF0261 family)
MSKQIIILGALDSKGAEYAYLREQITAQGFETLVIDFGVLGEPGFAPDIGSAEVATAAGSDLAQLRAANDRGAALATMASGAAAVVRRLHAEGWVGGVIGMGGGGGSSVIATAMRTLPISVPKLLVSTMASGDTQPYVGTSNIAMLPAIVDVAGLNRISRQVIGQAAGAIAGMARVKAPAASGDRPLIAASMFGNTTACVDRCRAAIEAAGYEVLVFHATGTGGRTMEALVREGFISGVLDITTTEWADELAGGVLSAGPARLEAAGAAGVPQLVVPGCIDMVNFGPQESVPARYADRQLYAWNPSVTLMRTTVEENAELGRIFAEKLNAAHGPVHVLIPLRGYSILDSPGERFWNPQADRAFVDALRADLHAEIPVEMLDLNINDPAFAERAVEVMLELLSVTR